MSYTPTEAHEVRNAIIADAYITTENHGLIDCVIRLDFGSSSQAFGGYHLGAANDTTGRNAKGGNYLGEYVARVLLAAGVHRFDSLTGKAVRVSREPEAGNIEAIGHILRDDLWFCPRATFNGWRKNEAKP